VKATFHDELLREAGFESDYYADLEQRRARRRRKLKVEFLRAVRAIAVATVLLGISMWVVDVRRASEGVEGSRAWLIFGMAVLLVGFAADLLLDDMRGEGEPSGLVRRALWRLGRAGVRAWKSAARRRESDA
jgi:hypothetical protein